MKHDKIDFLKSQGCFNKNAQRVKDSLFEKYDFFDKNDLAQVKYEMLRKTNIDGWTISKSCRIFGFSRPSFYEIKSEFEQHGLDGLLPSKRGPKKPHKMTQPVIEIINKNKEINPSIRSADLVDIINKSLGIQIHARSIHRYLSHHKKKRTENKKSRSGLT